MKKGEEDVDDKKSERDEKSEEGEKGEKSEQDEEEEECEKCEKCEKDEKSEEDKDDKKSGKGEEDEKSKEDEEGENNKENNENKELSNENFKDSSIEEQTNEKEIFELTPEDEFRIDKREIKKFTKFWYRNNQSNLMTITNNEIPITLIEYLKNKIEKRQKIHGSWSIQSLKSLINESKKNIRYLWKPKDKCFIELCTKYPNYVVNGQIQLENEVVRDMVYNKFSFKITDEDATKIAKWILLDKESFYSYTKPDYLKND
ncbi:hypothetical protein DICPUDRAFT_77362 [Dictyostelium purpureum]|uniref:Uncharacterized protein n=1 Tax=Dictyostelium purpureum TaxID=5786 RepID=F0ZGE0_DICPU|nr:uncharacterized protein DICPUDRAFT_77362 [Dictyostelium purpureum]EGC36993.1 hypothetical protein DICPUDRAFT_77362 [Dictyostelium purpureum]|eukprot:XP_003286490.1 hypothetical protein DICPUDRAFT_77362 [Dictyostelium purpureum]